MSNPRGLVCVLSLIIDFDRIDGNLNSSNVSLLLNNTIFKPSYKGFKKQRIITQLYE